MTQPQPLPQPVVAATDFSVSALRAVRRAAGLAQAHQRPLTLLHVMDTDGLTRLSAWFKGQHGLSQALAEQARLALGQTASELQGELGVAASTALREGAGSPASEITAAGDAAGLLVVGAHGAHAMGDLALGTTTDRVLRKARGPLLVVKSEGTAPYQQVLVLLDFSPASELALASALALAPEASFELLHILELPYEGQLFRAGVSDAQVNAQVSAEQTRAREALHELLQGLAPERRQAMAVAVKHGEVRRLALDAVRELAPDLVVVGKQGRSRLEDLFLGSLTRTLLAQAPCDVLVAPGMATAADGAS